ncbi:phosphatase PAP2 family protein [Streptomyces sp. NPDC014733]|uniref:phosphatase PAP2 family protein n=1 Tax=Streptomyces sp. NPDC014733 TaxID=3364885 RepID=UPI0036F6A8D3
MTSSERRAAPTPRPLGSSSRHPSPRAPLAVFLGCAVPAVVLTVLVTAGWAPLLRLDRSVADTLHTTAVGAPGWTHLNRILTDWVWDPWTMRTVLAVTVVLLLRRGAWLLGVWVAATSLLGTALQQGLKAAVDRDRPVWPDPVDSAHYQAFPSGHALSVTVAGGLLLWLLHRHAPRPARWWAAVAVVAVSMAGVGFTRVFLGVHWLSDVVGGWLFGATVVAAAVTAHRVYERRRTAGRAA